MIRCLLFQSSIFQIEDWTICSPFQRKGDKIEDSHFSNSIQLLPSNLKFVQSSIFQICSIFNFSNLRTNSFNLKFFKFVLKFFEFKTEQI